MLVVAALLFVIYGLAGFSGAAKFAVVLGLNLFFGVAGYYCYGSRRLRVVGPSYVALFALMSPLVLLAAYEFLYLQERGIQPDLAIFIGGVYCTVLYGILAARLHSAAYAILSLVALPWRWSASPATSTSWTGSAWCWRWWRRCTPSCRWRRARKRRAPLPGSGAGRLARARRPRHRGRTGQHGSGQLRRHHADNGSR